MKKIIIFNLPMKSVEGDKVCFLGKGNIDSKYEGKVSFGLIAALYGKIKEKDDVLVLLNETSTDFPSNNEKNIELFKKEFENVLKIRLKEGENLQIIASSFTESRQDMQELYRKLLSYIEEDCWIYADTTFGPRLNLPIIFSLLHFAEKFYNAEIKLLLNVKARFNPKTNELVENSQALYDILPFYNLSNMTMAMKAQDGKQALKMLDDFFNL